MAHIKFTLNMTVGLHFKRIRVRRVVRARAASIRLLFVGHAAQDILRDVEGEIIHARRGTDMIAAHEDTKERKGRSQGKDSVKDRLKVVVFQLPE